MLCRYIFKHDNDNIDQGDIVFPIKKRFNSKEKLPMVMLYPKGEKEELGRQLEFLEDYLNGFEMALQKKTFADPAQGYAKYVPNLLSLTPPLLLILCMTFILQKDAH